MKTETVFFEIAVRQSYEKLDSNWLFSAFPPSLNPFHAFDPDSYSVISAIYDSLLSIGNDGSLMPCLAKSCLFCYKKFF